MFFQYSVRLSFSDFHVFFSDWLSENSIEFMFWLLITGLPLFVFKIFHTVSILRFLCLFIFSILTIVQISFVKSFSLEYFFHSFLAIITKSYFYFFCFVQLTPFISKTILLLFLGILILLLLSQQLSSLFLFLFFFLAVRF